MLTEAEGFQKKDRMVIKKYVIRFIIFIFIVFAIVFIIVGWKRERGKAFVEYDLNNRAIKITNKLGGYYRERISILD